jgi:hypothetical protein
MPDWSGILQELLQSAHANGGQTDFDGVRRKYLAAVAAHTGRSTILYAAKFTQPAAAEIGQFVAIDDHDLQGIMTVIHNMQGPNLDLILHSPGGSPHAAESLVNYLRSKFSHIRVIVPHLAMSAAAMIACAADSIVLGKHSFLGPIDPQLVFSGPGGTKMVPAQAILDQFELAKQECQDPKKMGAWMPMLGQYGPGLLMQCRNSSDLSEQLVTNWLQQYMFKGQRGRKTKAMKIAKWLSAHKHWKSHGRQIPRTDLEAKGLKVEHLEVDPVAQDLFLSVFHAATHTFLGTPAVKIIESHTGVAFVQQAMISHPRQAPPAPPQPQQPRQPGPSAPPQQPPAAAP